MALFRTIALGVLRSVAGNGVASVAERVVQHLQPKGGVLVMALGASHERAAHVLACSLADDEGLRTWAASLVSDGDTRQAVEQTKSRLWADPLCDSAEKRAAVMVELQQAAQHGWLAHPPDDAGQEVAGEVERGQLVDLRSAERLPRDLEGLPRLAAVVAIDTGGMPLLVALARRFFVLRVQQDAGLAHVVQLAGMERLQESVDAVRSDVHAIGDKLEGLEDRLMARVASLLQQTQLADQPLSARHSSSLQSGVETRQLAEVMEQSRALATPTPELQHGLGKLLVAAGQYDQAGKCLDAALAGSVDAHARADVAWSAYRAAVERRAWPEALAALAETKGDERYCLFDYDEYRPLAILGAGGYATAFLCHEETLDRDVVVKALATEELARDAGEVFAEARVLIKLSHPNIVPVFHAGYGWRAERRHPYLVVERVGGGNLATLLGGKAMAVADFLPIACQVAEALAAAHGQNVLHRHLKPENVVVEEAGSGFHARVIDFGLAVRLTGEAGSPGQSHLLADRAGTLVYAPPEQLQGGALGPWSDVYAFGKICCVALTGVAEPKRRHWQDIPEPLVDLLERCTDPDAQHRPQSFASVLAELRPAQAQPRPAQPQPAAPPPPPPTAPVAAALADDDAVLQHMEMLREDPFRIECLRALCRIYAASRQYDKAWCVCAALAFLNQADPEERQLLAAYPARGASRPANGETWDGFHHPAEDRSISAMLGAVWHAVVADRPDPLSAAGLTRKHRRTLENDPEPFVKLLYYAQQVLNVSPPAVFLQPEQPGKLFVVNADDKGTLVSAVVARADMRGMSEKDTLFLVGRMLSLIRPEHNLRLVLPKEELMQVLLAALALARPDLAAADRKLAERMRARLAHEPAAANALVVAVEQYLQQPQALGAALERWWTAVNLTADRAGFVLCGDLAVAASSLAANLDAATTRARMGELVLYSIGEPYFAARRQLGLAVNGTGG